MEELRTVLALDVHEPVQTGLGTLDGRDGVGIVFGHPLGAEQGTEVVRHGERKGEPAVDRRREQGVGTQPVGTVVGPARLAAGEEALDGRHHVEVGPQATHGEVAGGGDAHRSDVGILADGLLVHLEEVRVPLPDGVLAETFDGVTEIEVGGVVHRATTESGNDLLRNRAGGDVTGDQVAEGRIAALEEVVALVLGDRVRVAVVLRLLRRPDAAVVAEGLRHEDRLGLPLRVDRQAGRVELDERGAGHVGAVLVSTHDRGCVRILRQRRHVVDVAVTTGAQDHGMTRVGREFAGDEVTHDGTVAALRAVLLLLDDQVDHLVVGEDLDRSEVDLTLQGGRCGELELLSRLATRVIGAGDLDTTE